MGRNMSCKSSVQIASDSSRYDRILCKYNIFTAFLIIRSQVEDGSYLLHFCLWSSHLKNATTIKHSSICQAKMFDFLIAMKDLSLLVHCTESIPAFRYLSVLVLLLCLVWFDFETSLTKYSFFQIKLRLSLSTST